MLSYRANLPQNRVFMTWPVSDINPDLRYFPQFLPPRSPILFRYQFLACYTFIERREAIAFGFRSLYDWCERHPSQQSPSCPVCGHLVCPVKFCTCVIKSPFGACRLSHSPHLAVWNVSVPTRPVLRFACGCVLSYSPYVPKIFSR